MKAKQKIIYYTNETEDEFSEAKITPRKIDGSYPYDNQKLSRKIGHTFFYTVLARPFARLFLKLKFHHRVENGDVIAKTIKERGPSGFFLFGNHTHALADALIPSIVCPTFADVYVIVHPNNVSMPVLGKITPSLGAVPLPNDGAAARNFLKTLQGEISHNNCVTIYPEAHIWPYYTGIRNFPDTSFTYPIKYHVPVFSFTNTYQKRAKGDGIDIVTYVDGPFYPDESLSAGERKRDLRDRVYETMKTRAKNNTAELIKYVKAEDSTISNTERD